MKLKKLQEKVAEVIVAGDSVKLTLPYTWLCEESGEIAKVFKRAFKDDKEIDIGMLTEEAGDVLMALVSLVNGMGGDLDEIADEALEKWKEKWSSVETD